VLEQIESSLGQVSADVKSSVITSIQATVERVGRIGASLRWAQVLRKVGEQAKAIAEFERAVDLDPENATAQVELAKALTADGRFVDAADHSLRAVAIGGGDPESLNAALDAFKAAVMHLESDRYINAMDDAIRTIDGASACALWADALGELYRPGAQLMHAKKTFEKNPTAWSHAKYAYLLVGAGKSEEGLAEHARAAEREPDSEGVHRLWGSSAGRLAALSRGLGAFPARRRTQGPGALFRLGDRTRQSRPERGRGRKVRGAYAAQEQ
jgi:tetratricopeptide (TPR) repeat protein